MNGREYVSSADITGLFGLVLREDRAGGLVITMGARTVVVSLTQGLASVDGRVVSLPAPPMRQGSTWLLPIELIERALAQARAKGHRLVVLVGDEPYYGKAGFRPIAKDRTAMPGPVDPARLLVCELADGAFDGVSGPIRPDWTAD